MRAETELDAEVDALIAAAVPGHRQPTVQRREVVLVAGPRQAGVSTVRDALAHRMPARRFVETLGADEVPLLTVFVTSAAAPLTGSDCELFAEVTDGTDAVIAVVAKIDRYRNWREVLDQDRALLGERCRDDRPVRWTGAAAGPDLGEACVEELVAAVAAALEDPTLARRNRLRAWESALVRTGMRLRRDTEDAAIAALRERRTELLGRHRRELGERAERLRARLQQAHIEAVYGVRRRCASLRAELTAEVAALSRPRMCGFVAGARRRATEVLAAIDDELGAQLGSPPEGPRLCGPPVFGAPDGPRLRAGGSEDRLMVVLGSGFGMGLALTLNRVFAGLVPGPVGVAACVPAGAAVALWMVATRRLLRERAELTGWVTTMTAALRTGAERRVAARLAAEAQRLRRELVCDAEVRSARTAAELAEIDAELRRCLRAQARARAGARRGSAAVDCALALIRAELAASGDEMRETESFL